MSAFSSPGNAQSSSRNPPITPLRIAKRASPQPGRSKLESIQLARRTSSSYKHVRNNNLVSKSPFKSQIPTPSPARPSPGADVPSLPTQRRVSGEKRPRPLSMTEPLENEAPFKRRQSRGLQGLIEREPVSNSPFKQRAESQTERSVTPPAVPEKLTVDTTTTQPALSPRSALVSRRLHGPRSNDGQNPLGSRRQRRKTVTFNECCDVVEFDQESIELRDDDPFYSDGEDGEEDEDGEGPDVDVDDLDLTAPFTPNPAEVHTPVSTSPLPPDMETEDGVPYGRTHHHDRHLVRTEDIEDPPSLDSPSSSLPQLDAITPEKYRGHLALTSSPVHAVTRAFATEEEEKEHVQTQEPQQDILPNAASSANTNTGPTAPSPPVAIKDEPSLIELSFISSSSLDPANLSIGQTEVSLSGLEEEFGLSPGREPQSSLELAPVAPLRLSLSPSHSPRGALPILPRSASPLNPGGGLGSRASPAPPSPLGRRGSPALASPLGRMGSPLAGGHLSGSANGRSSPYARVGSPFNRGEAGSPFGRVSGEGELGDSLSGRRSPRISRDDVQRRLQTKRSIESPLREVPHIPIGEKVDMKKEMPEEEVWIKETSSGFIDPADLGKIASAEMTVDNSLEDATLDKAIKATVQQAVAVGEKKPLMLNHLSRQDNPTYDGVMSIDPTPAPTDPPRPLLPRRAHTLADGETDFRSSLGEGDLNISPSLPLMTDTEGEPDFKGSLTTSLAGMRLSEMSALDRLMEDVGGAEGRGMRVEALGEGVVAGRYGLSEDGSVETTQEDVPALPQAQEQRPVVGRGETDPAALSTSQFGFTGNIGGVTSRNVSGSSIPPAVPPKDAIRTREEMIIEKRREARRKEIGLSVDVGCLSPSTALLGNGLPEGVVARPSRRRSMSTGDAEDMKRLELTMPMSMEDGDELAESIDRELRRRGGDTRAKYRVREHEGTIYASADADRDRIRHMTSTGDLDGGGAWRAVRRPSDMNEYAKQIRAYRAQDKSGKMFGKLFVKVLGVRNLKVPIPREPTVMTCTLNNGIHFVTTPEVILSPSSVIGQEFELLEHAGLEFTLTLRIRRDHHIVSMFQAITPPTPRPTPPPPPPPASKGGLRSFFSSPKKSSHVAQRLVPAPPREPRIPENLARYLTPDCVLGRAMVSFKEQDIASRCDTKLFETAFPLLGQRLETDMQTTHIQIGEILLQMFRFPALPGVPPSKLPQSLQECHEGLRNIQWHKQTYFEGTLTQSGGDCTTWRRRPFRIIGANLIAFNDVTKRPTATIDLKKAVAVQDDEERACSAATGDDSLLGMERSFRLLFPKDQQIIFFADTDQEKTRWLEVLRALVSRIPPNPFWAELVWQRQDEQSRRQGSSGHHTSSIVHDPPPS
ncbi:hypothetical protein NEOLEDRAFT_1183069 [Neolentinus lepideus HHB14362 ss-1]|uniref:PH domain-containing protein n=1 Tax=Neolentinus lepideus HHB14362 ss-1 TaxID=1314782 RepID=A0A165NM20_9AGAM|nr:hypothetical protein NEOLEDRAFT_1183069 [Neolentinus lepideus HHB14362 ss-1]